MQDNVFVRWMLVEVGLGMKLLVGLLMLIMINGTMVDIPSYAVITWGLRDTLERGGRSVIPLLLIFF